MAASALIRNARKVLQWPESFFASSSRDARIHLWAFLNPIFNRVDDARVKEVGPDRAAAEWIVRCGGSVRWQGLERYHKDYNTLPPGRISLEAIDATDSCIMDVGFTHLKGLEHLKELNLTSCQWVNDRCLQLLSMYQRDVLQELRIVSCANVTDAGLAHLVEMKALQSLVMARLASVDDPRQCLRTLESALPACKIEFQIPG